MIVSVEFNGRQKLLEIDDMEELHAKALKEFRIQGGINFFLGSVSFYRLSSSLNCSFYRYERFEHSVR